MSKQRFKMVKSINSVDKNNGSDNNNNNKKEFCDALNWCIDCLKSNNYYASDIHSETTISWRSYEIGKEIFRSIIEIIKKHNLIDDDTNCCINESDVFNYANVCVPSSIGVNKNTDVVIDDDVANTVDNLIDKNKNINDDNNTSIQIDCRNSLVECNYTGEIERLETDFSDNESCYNNDNNKKLSNLCDYKKNGVTISNEVAISNDVVIEKKSDIVSGDKIVKTKILVDAKIADLTPGPPVDKDDIEEFEPENLPDEEEDMDIDSDDTSDTDAEEKLESVVVVVEKDDEMVVDKCDPVVDDKPVQLDTEIINEKIEDIIVDEAVSVEKDHDLKVDKEIPVSEVCQIEEINSSKAQSEDGIEEFDPVNLSDQDEEETENEMEREIPVLANKLLINKTIKIDKALLEKAKCLEPIKNKISSIKDPFVRPILLSKIDKTEGKIFNNKNKIVKLKLPIFSGKIKNIVTTPVKKQEEKKPEKEVVNNEEYEIEKLDEEILNNENTPVSKISPGEEYEIEELDEEILNNDKTIVEKNLPSEEYEIESLDDVILNNDSTNVNKILPPQEGEIEESKKDQILNEQNKIVDASEPNETDKGEEEILNNKNICVNQIEEEEEVMEIINNENPSVVQISSMEEDKIEEFEEEEVLSVEGTIDDRSTLIKDDKLETLENENEIEQDKNNEPLSHDERNKIEEFIPVISLDEDIEENLEKSIIKRFESATSDDDDVTEEKSSVNNSDDDEFEAEYLTHEDMIIEQDVEPDSTREDQSEMLESEVLDTEDETVQFNNVNEERTEEEEEDEEMERVEEEIFDSTVENVVGKKNEETASNPEDNDPENGKKIQEEEKEIPSETIFENIAEEIIENNLPLEEADKVKRLEENCNNNSDKIIQLPTQVNKNEIFEFQQVNSNNENIYHGENISLGEIHIQKVGGEIGQGEKILVSLNLLLGPDETEKAKVEIVECGILKNKDAVFGKDMVFVSPKMIVRIEDENTSNITKKQAIFSTENTTKEDPIINTTKIQTTTEIITKNQEEVVDKNLSLEKTEINQYNNYEAVISTNRGTNDVTMTQVTSPNNGIEKHDPQDAARSVTQISKPEIRLTNPIVQIEKLDFQVTRSLQTTKIDVGISTPTTPIWEKNVTMDNDVPLDCTKKDKVNNKLEDTSSLNNPVDPMFQQNDKIISTQSPIQQSVIDSVFESNHAYSAQDISMCPVSELHQSINPTSMNTVDIINDGVEESLDLQIGGQHVIQVLQNGIEEQYCSSLMNGDARDDSQQQNVYVDKEQQDQRYFPNFMQSSDVFGQLPDNNSVYNHCPPVATSMTLNEDGQEQQHPLGWTEEVRHEEEEEENDEDEAQVSLQGIPINYSHSPESELSSSMIEIRKIMQYDMDNAQYEPPTRRRRKSQEKKQEPKEKKIEPPAKRQRNYIPYEDKYKAIDLASKNPDWNIETLREQTGCPCLINLGQIRTWTAQFADTNSEFSKRQKINEIVFAKFTENQKNSKRITNETVKMWGAEVNKRLPKPTKFYNANDEWLYNFKKAYNITDYSGQLIHIGSSNDTATADEEDSQPIEDDNFNENEHENDNFNENEHDDDNFNENNHLNENENENYDENEDAEVDPMDNNCKLRPANIVQEKTITIKNGRKRLKRINLSPDEKIRIIRMVRNNPHWTLGTLIKHSGARIKSFTQIYHWEKKLKKDGKLIVEKVSSDGENKNEEDQPLSKLLEMRRRQHREKMMSKKSVKKRGETKIKTSGKKRGDKKNVTLAVGKKRGERKIKLSGKQRSEAQIRIVGKKRNAKSRGKRKTEKSQTTIDEKNQNLEQEQFIDTKLKGKNVEKLINPYMTKEARREIFNDSVYLKCVEYKNRGFKLTNRSIRRWVTQYNNVLDPGDDFIADRSWRKDFKLKYKITGKYCDLQIDPEPSSQAPPDNNTAVENFDYQEEKAEEDEEEKEEAEEEEEEEKEEAEEEEEEEDESTAVRNDDDDDDDDDDNEDEDEEDNNDKTFNHHDLSSIAQTDDQDKYTPESLKNIMNSNDKKVKIVSVETGPTISEAIFDPMNGIKWRVGTP